MYNKAEKGKKITEIRASRQRIKNNEITHVILCLKGVATKRWILKRPHQRTVFA
jgi:hypothetical protein